MADAEREALDERRDLADRLEYRAMTNRSPSRISYRYGVDCHTSDGYGWRRRVAFQSGHQRDRSGGRRRGLCVAAVAMACVWAELACAADKAEIRASLEAAIADYEACNRSAIEEARDIQGRSVGWKAVYAEGTCLHMLEPVNQYMLELYVPDVTFYKIQNLRTTTLRNNMEQIHSPHMP